MLRSGRCQRRGSPRNLEGSRRRFTGCSNGCTSNQYRYGIRTSRGVMTEFVSTAWVEEHLNDANYLILDPRRPMKYLSGHLKGAVNLPAYKAFDDQLALLPSETLAKWIGAVGLDDRRSPILYDSFDGQNASVIAWILEYLGRDDVRIMNRFYDHWLAEKREVLYKPVQAMS